MPRTVDDLTPDALAFLAERHLGTITTLRADGTPQVVAVGFTFDPEQGIARVITSGDSAKVRNARRRGRVALSQVDGRRWLTLEGSARVLTDAESVADAEARYARRYRVPRPNPKRVVIAVPITRVLGSRSLFEAEPTER